VVAKRVVRLLRVPPCRDPIRRDAATVPQASVWPQRRGKQTKKDFELYFMSQRQWRKDHPSLCAQRW